MESVEKYYKRLQQIVKLRIPDVKYEEIEDIAKDYKIAIKSEPKDGNFCMSCGTCCKKAELIEFTEEEAQTLKMVYNLSIAKTFKQDNDTFYLKASKPCPFYHKEKGCAIYEHRPITCRRYPYFGYEEDIYMVIDSDCLLALKTVANEIVKQLKKR